MKKKYLNISSGLSLNNISIINDNNIKNTSLLSPNHKYYETKKLNLPKIKIIKKNLSDIDLSYLEKKHIENKKTNFYRKQKSQIIKNDIVRNKPNITRKNSTPFHLQVNPAKFHNNLMNKNISSFNKSQIDEYMEQIKNNKHKELDTLKHYRESCITGIYGPSTNILSVIRANIERLKYDNDYSGVKNDIKEMIKDELMAAQVKLKIKPKPLNYDKLNKIKPLYLKKFDDIKYISAKNKINIINQTAKTPSMLDDGTVISTYMNDSTII